jgi:hypothetical protein
MSLDFLKDHQSMLLTYRGLAVVGALRMGFIGENMSSENTSKGHKDIGRGSPRESGCTSRERVRLPRWLSLAQ